MSIVLRMFIFAACILPLVAFSTGTIVILRHYQLPDQFAFPLIAAMLLTLTFKLFLPVRADEVDTERHI